MKEIVVSIRFKEGKTLLFFDKYMKYYVGGDFNSSNKKIRIHLAGLWSWNPNFRSFKKNLIKTITHEYLHYAINKSIKKPEQTSKELDKPLTHYASLPPKPKGIGFP